jgi:3',5'-cyclic AMP phosphodiesterase CpdA
MTDIHVQPELQADERFKAAISKVNELKPDFVITGGDLIMDAFEQTEERAKLLYELYLEISEEFNMPVFNTIGNHDVFGLRAQSGVSADHPQYGKKMFENYLGNGKTYFSFDHKGWHFIFLDSIGLTSDGYYGVIDETQLEWLINDLKGVNNVRPIVVSIHIPLVSVFEQMRTHPTAALSPDLVVTNSFEVLDLFRDHNLTLVLQGHLHFVEEIVFRDVHFITGGAVSGAWWNGELNGFQEGFVVVNVKDYEFSWSYEPYDWGVEE